MPRNHDIAELRRLDVAHHLPAQADWAEIEKLGGSRIITTVLQVLLNRLVHGLNLASAVASPRIHSQLWPDQISVEQGLSPDTTARLEALGHRSMAGPDLARAEVDGSEENTTEIQSHKLRYYAREFVKKSERERVSGGVGVGVGGLPNPRPVSGFTAAFVEGSISGVPQVF